MAMEKISKNKYGKYCDLSLESSSSTEASPKDSGRGERGGAIIIY